MQVSLAGLLQFYAFAPMEFLHLLGKCLLWIGTDRLVYGSEGFVFPDIQRTIEIFAGVQIPEQMQADWGYPPITPEQREAMFGANYARILGLDISEKRNELAAAL